VSLTYTHFAASFYSLLSLVLTYDFSESFGFDLISTDII